MDTKELIKKLKSNRVMLFDHPIMNEVIQKLKEYDELIQVIEEKCYDICMKEGKDSKFDI